MGLYARLESPRCMVVHMLRVTVATVDPEDQAVDLQAKKQTVQNWVANHQEVLQAASSSFSTGNTEEDGSGTEFAWGSWRFAWEENPTQLKDDIATWLGNNFAWWIVAYHECDHDNPAGGCSWDNEWTGGNPPADLQVMA